MTIVYRIEQDNGDGPYFGKTRYEIRYDFIHGSVSHPGPQQDNLSMFSHEHICGFKDIKSYKKWFCTGVCRKSLRDLDFKLNVYSLLNYNIEYGKTQVIFKRKHAEKIMSLDPYYLRVIQ